MKKIFLFLMMMVLFAACEQGPNTTPQQTLKLSADNDEIVADGIQSVTFTVKDKDNVEVTDAIIYFAETDEAIGSNTFKTDTAGSYTFYAMKNHNKSNSLTITAKAATNNEGGNDEGNDDNEDGNDDNDSDDGSNDNIDTVFEAMFPDNTQVWYNTSDMSKCEFSAEQPFDANIVSNEFGACANGQCYSFFGIGFDAEVTKVNKEAFCNSNLEIVYLPHSIKTIDQASFFGSTNLNTVHIGAGIEDIAVGAFTDCDNLTKLYIRATTPPSLGDDNAFEDATIYVPAEAVSAYKSHIAWNGYNIVGYDFATGKETTDGDDSSEDEAGDDGNNDGTTPDDPQPAIEGFNQRVLLTKHTASWCTNCPAMSGVIKEFFTTYPDWADNYNLIECHSSDADRGTTKEDKAYSDAALVVFKFHNAAGYPELDTNFKSAYAHNNSKFMSDMSSTFSKLIKPNGADVGIAITTTGDADKVCATAVVKAAVEKEYKITAWLLEDNIRNDYQENATKEEDYIYKHALRDIAGEYSVEDLSGESLGVIKVQDSVEKSFEFSIAGTSWNPENMEVLIIVSAKDASQRWEVVNTALCPVNNTIDFEYM